MKNLRKFEMMADKDIAILEEYSVSYVAENDKVYTTHENGGQGGVDYSTMYTTFEALEDGTFSFSKKVTGDDIQYSKDNGSTWTPLASGETVSVVTGDKVMWKSTIAPSSSNGIGTFSSSNKFNVSGNIMSLLYGDDFVGQTSLEGKNNAFYALFSGCTQLIDASNLCLPATTLARSCYYNMFEDCTSLTTAPELPATTLVYGCYSWMFRSCTSLTTAPELPATTLVDECYYSMFANCTGLTTAPELPATTLTDKCYYNMFRSCTSLTTAPELPATTLAWQCYSNMFDSCTSLTESPVLPATNLVRQCYSYMFRNCTSLTTAPELPSTTLAEACYSKMFSGCTSLTTAPELPATTLVDECYSYMFDECANLNHITMLATNISANNSLYYWVRGVASTGTFVKHPNMTTLPTGIKGIPKSWTVEDADI